MPWFKERRLYAIKTMLIIIYLNTDNFLIIILIWLMDYKKWLYNR